MKEHLEADLTAAEGEEFTLARNRMTAYRRYVDGEITLEQAQYLVTKGHECVTCDAWVGEP